VFRGKRQKTGSDILYPFSGTGSTSIAAMLLKRDYIGIEISPEYHEIALKRLGHFRRKKAA
jgi:DNA modification methylase